MTVRLPQCLTAVAIVFALAACGAPTTVPTPFPSNGPDPATYRYSCEGPPGFQPTLMEQPGTAELEDHPSAQGLRDFLSEDSAGLGLLPDSGWWLVSRNEGEAQYIARLPDGVESPFGYVTLQPSGAEWGFASGGLCLPTVLFEGRVSATWTLPPNLRPQPTTVEFVALVTDSGCTGGEPVGARLLPPAITYAQTSVFIVFSARPFHEGLTTCQGKPPTEAVVQLREPLGTRNLLDAGVFPAADPVAP